MNCNVFALRALVGVALLATHSFAHMILEYPAPFNASNNPHRTTPADPYLDYPYECCGPNDRWQYPCRGYQNLLGTAEGAPTATWQAGSTANWNLTGTGTHYGGSCQVGFSVDGGDTFRVATSYEGSCPHRRPTDEQNFEIKVPDDLKPGVQIFAWIWYNREQELNMNCAAVRITAPNSDATAPTSYGGNGTTATSLVFHDRPLMFVADDGNDCETPKTNWELKFPDPGAEVVTGDGEYPLELPTGEGCVQSRMLLKQAYNGANGNDGHVSA